MQLIIPILVLIGSISAIPLCPNYKTNFYTAHDNKLNSPKKLHNFFWNRIWKLPSISYTPREKRSYNSIYEKYLPKPSKFGFAGNANAMLGGLGTIDEMLEQDELGVEVLNWLDCRSKVVDIDFRNNDLRN